ncbi:MAG: winged helix-turn-helix transcriptional regulator [Chloroflexota bacterium]
MSIAALVYPASDSGVEAAASEPDTSCPVARTAAVIGSKWTLLIIRDLTGGKKRFNELEKSLGGISAKTLSERLRSLEQEGIINRRAYAEIPPRVEYRLTEKGLALLSLIKSMREYGQRWL